MKQYIFITLLLTLAFKALSCECVEYTLEDLDSVSYSYDEIILIGDVIEDGSNFKIVVSEILKGDVYSDTLNGTPKMKLIVEEDTIIGETSCSGRFYNKGRYLIYLNEIIIENNRLYSLGSCSATRSLDMEYLPFCLDYYSDKSKLLNYTNQWIEELRRLKKTD